MDHKLNVSCTRQLCRIYRLGLFTASKTMKWASPPAGGLRTKSLGGREGSHLSDTAAEQLQKWRKVKLAGNGCAERSPGSSDYGVDSCLLETHLGGLPRCLDAHDRRISESRGKGCQKKKDPFSCSSRSQGSPYMMLPTPKEPGQGL